MHSSHWTQHLYTITEHSYAEKYKLDKIIKIDHLVERESYSLYTSKIFGTLYNQNYRLVSPK